MVYMDQIKGAEYGFTRGARLASHKSLIFAAKSVHVCRHTKQK